MLKTLQTEISLLFSIQPAVHRTSTKSRAGPVTLNAYASCGYPPFPSPVVSSAAFPPTAIVFTATARSTAKRCK